MFPYVFPNVCFKFGLNTTFIQKLFTHKIVFDAFYKTSQLLTVLSKITTNVTNEQNPTRNKKTIIQSQTASNAKTQLSDTVKSKTQFDRY